MGYLSDWRDAENAMLAAHAANPDCDETLTCPADDDGHLLSCRRWRSERRRSANSPTPSDDQSTDDAPHRQQL